MGQRLSKIYTKTGDTGKTGLGDGRRVDKDCCRVEAYGAVDELNSVIAMVLAVDNLPEPLQKNFLQIQHTLFDLGGELSIPGYQSIKSSHIEALELELDAINTKLPTLKEFILPGGGLAGAACHLARTICRRAERRVITLNRTEPVNKYAIIFLNRLSDFLFVAARSIALHEKGQEVLWQHERQ